MVEAGTTINHISWLRLGFKQYGGVTCEYFSTRILGNMQCLNDQVQQFFLELKKEVKMNMNMLRDNLHYGTPDLCNPSCLQQRKPRSDERQVQVQDPQPAPQLYPSSPPLPLHWPAAGSIHRPDQPSTTGKLVKRANHQEKVSVPPIPLHKFN